MKKVIISLVVVLAIGAGILVWLFVLKDKDPKTYTVTFDSKGGSNVESIKVECEKELVLPTNPTKEGYEFVSWIDKNGKSILNGALLTCEDVTLYADWKEEVKTFKVTFDSKGGSDVEPVTVECGKTMTMPTNPTKEGYTFRVWEDQHGTAILDGVLFACEGDVTLYAVWDEE